MWSDPTFFKIDNTKILIATGNLIANVSEVIDLSESGSNCSNFDNYPIDVIGATGGLLDNETPLVCGGRSPTWPYPLTNSCYIIGHGDDIAVKMSVKRKDAASIVLDDGKTLFVTGGVSWQADFNTDNDLKTTELIQFNGGSGSTSPGPEMPITLSTHSMVVLNTSTAMIIGGWHATISSAKTFYLDMNTFTWTNGPDLKTARHYASAATMTDSVTNIQYVVVTGGLNHHDLGGSNIGMTTLSSVEVLSLPSGQEWTPGKFFDFAILISMKCFLYDFCHHWKFPLEGIFTMISNHFIA